MLLSTIFLPLLKVFQSIFFNIFFSDIICIGTLYGEIKTESIYHVVEGNMVIPLTKTNQSQQWEVLVSGPRKLDNPSSIDPYSLNYLARSKASFLTFFFFKLFFLYFTFFVTFVSLINYSYGIFKERANTKKHSIFICNQHKKTNLMRYWLLVMC